MTKTRKITRKDNRKKYCFVRFLKEENRKKVARRITIIYCFVWLSTILSQNHSHKVTDSFTPSFCSSFRHCIAYYSILLFLLLRLPTHFCFRFFKQALFTNNYCFFDSLCRYGSFHFLFFILPF